MMPPFHVLQLVDGLEKLSVRHHQPTVEMEFTNKSLRKERSFLSPYCCLIVTYWQNICEKYILPAGKLIARIFIFYCPCVSTLRC